jgi:hypothetical protein
LARPCSHPRIYRPNPASQLGSPPLPSWLALQKLPEIKVWSLPVGPPPRNCRPSPVSQLGSPPLPSWLALEKLPENKVWSSKLAQARTVPSLYAGLGQNGKKRSSPDPAIKTTTENIKTHLHRNAGPGQTARMSICTHIFTHYIYIYIVELWNIHYIHIFIHVHSCICVTVYIHNLHTNMPAMCVCAMCKSGCRPAARAPNWHTEVLTDRTRPGTIAHSNAVGNCTGARRSVTSGYLRGPKRIRAAELKLRNEDSAQTRIMSANAKCANSTARTAGSTPAICLYRQGNLANRTSASAAALRQVRCAMCAAAGALRHVRCATCAAPFHPKMDISQKIVKS